MVDEGYERHLAQQARVREKQRQREIWRVARGRLVDGIEFVKVGRLPRGVLSDVAVIEKVLRKVDRRIGA
jgi:hypothetical protein